MLIYFTFVIVICCSLCLKHQCSWEHSPNLNGATALTPIQLCDSNGGGGWWWGWLPITIRRSGVSHENVARAWPTKLLGIF